MNLSKWTKILNYWTIIVVILLIPLIVLSFNPLYSDPLFAIAALVYLLILLFPLIIARFIKDTQIQILVTLVRGFIGFLPPIALIFLTFGPLSLYWIIISAIFLLVGLIICALILLQVLALNRLTKQLLQAQK